MIMKTTPDVTPDERVRREIERERHERARHDEQRAGLDADDEFRLKDVREKTGAVNVRRSGDGSR
jgi:hypothetical protein